jgi:MFS family permease
LPLYVLFTANAISSTGDVLTFLAIPWFVLQTTGSVAQAGITAFFSTLSIAASAFFGSKVVDTLGFRRASVASDLLGAVAVALVPLLYGLRLLAFWELLALVFLAGLVTTPGATARSALVPDLAQLGGVRLERATAAEDGVTRVSRFFGAPLAGVLITLIGTSNLLWIDGASFALSALLIGIAVPRHSLASTPLASAASAPTEPPAAETATKTTYLAGLRAGVAFIWHDRLLLSLIATVLVTNLLDAGVGSVLMPAYILRTFGNAVVLGGMVASFGLAAFLGTIVYGAIGHRLPRRLTLGIGFTIGGAPRIWALALVPFVPALLAISALAGVGIAPVNPIFSTVTYERVPVSFRARVFGTTTAGAMAGTPLGGLIAGYCAVWLGLRWTLLLFGTVYLIATLSLLVNPAVRGIERPDKAAAPAPAA